MLFNDCLELTCLTYETSRLPGRYIPEVIPIIFSFKTDN